jgi:homocitrate synthase
MVVTAPEYVKSKYKLHMLKEIEDMVAEAVEVNTPFNNPITGFCAFTHKAGIHAKAILNNPSTYEILNPADFGLTRYVHFASRLTGWNAVKTRVGQLGLNMTDDQVKEVYVDFVTYIMKLKTDLSFLVPPRSRRWPTYGRSPSTTPTRSSAAST